MNSLIRQRMSFVLSGLSFLSGLLAIVLLVPSIASSQEEENVKPFAGMQFRCIGPFRGGRVTAVAGVPQHPSTFYFGAAGGGVWRSENAGTSWTNLSDGQFQTGSIGAIAVAPSDPNVIYAGTGEGPIRGVTTSHGDGMYRSTDGGQSWTHAGLLQARHVPAICIDPQDPDTLFVAAQGNPWGESDQRGVYRSRDGGANWEQVLHVNATTGACDLRMDSNNPRVLYAAMWDHQRNPWHVRSGGPGSGIYQSTDSGNSWKKLGGGLPQTMGKSGIAVSPADSQRLWALIEAEQGGLYRSDDGGKKWERINPARVLIARSWYYMHVFADPLDRQTVYVLNAPMLRSHDGGKTFEEVKTPHGDNHALWINPHNPQLMINGNDGGANVSLDGGKIWTSQMNQPTAQFYRVMTDNQFPYWVYGGQQDNSTVGIASATLESGIGDGDWHSVGGGESAHVALNPDHPELIYATSIVGWITEYDRRTRQARNIQAYPEIGLGSDARDLRYRFNWNAPVVVSAHDPNVIYHGANILLKSEDRGNHWSEVSPDLTRNEAGKHGQGGAPFTNEAAGAETYNTIFYIAESPQTPEVIWVGSDCGLVHVTRDSGANWINVTPPQLGEAQINCIEISPHDENTVYLAVAGYKLNDFSPQVYRTQDGGSNWQLLTRGLPVDSFVRVVREDMEKRGLLFAGTETGLFVWLDGVQWQPLQLNMPAVPVTDLRVQGDDLVVATQGRAFWILDQIQPLRQWTSQAARAPLHLYQPASTYRLGQADGYTSKPGKNRPRGAIIDFELGFDPDPQANEVVLEILDQQGQPVRRMSNRESELAKRYAANREPHAEPGEPYGLMKLDKGMNRIVWDLRRENIPCVDGHLIPMGWQGPTVPLGRYQLRLSMGDQLAETTLDVLADPRSDHSAQAWTEQASFVEETYRAIGELHEAINLMRTVDEQIDERLKLAAGHSEENEIAGKCRSVKEVLAAWEQPLIQSRRETQQDIVNFPPGVSLQLLYLMQLADSNEPPITDGARQRLYDLQSQWQRAQDAMQQILVKDVGALNEAFRSHEMPPVYLPQH